MPYPLAHAQRASIRAPMTATVRGQPHHLAYITPGEAELLRAHGGGIAPGGGQMTHKGIPAYAPNPVALLETPDGQPIPALNPAFYDYLARPGALSPFGVDALSQAFAQATAELAQGGDPTSPYAPVTTTGGATPGGTPGSAGASPSLKVGGPLAAQPVSASPAGASSAGPATTPGASPPDAPQGQGALSGISSGLSAINRLTGLGNYFSTGSLFGPGTTSFLNNLGASTGLFGNGAPVLTGANGMLTGGGAASSGTAATSGALGSTSLSGALSGAGIGAGVGSLLSMAGYGKPGYGTSIGGTIGGTIGSFLPIPGGTFIGSTIGSLIGGMFGPNPSVGPNANIRGRIGADGSFEQFAIGADNGGNPRGIRAFQSVVSGALEDATRATGVQLDPVNVGMSNIQGNYHGFIRSNGDYVRGFSHNPETGGRNLGGNPTLAAERMVEAVLRNAATGDAEATARLEDYLRSNAARGAVKDRIAGLGARGGGGAGRGPVAGGPPLPQGAVRAGSAGVGRIQAPQIEASAMMARPNPARFDPYSASRSLMALAGSR